MVIDTSALLAILQDEPERRSLNEAIEAADSRSLSVGDCFSYALAQVLGEPLRYKGEDLSRTDAARYPFPSGR